MRAAPRHGQAPRIPARQNPMSRIFYRESRHMRVEVKLALWHYAGRWLVAAQLPWVPQVIIGRIVLPPVSKDSADLSDYVKISPPCLVLPANPFGDTHSTLRTYGLKGTDLVYSSGYRKSPTAVDGWTTRTGKTKSRPRSCCSTIQ